MSTHPKKTIIKKYNNEKENLDRAIKKYKGNVKAHDLFIKSQLAVIMCDLDVLNSTYREHCFGTFPTSEFFFNKFKSKAKKIKMATAALKKITNDFERVNSRVEECILKCDPAYVDPKEQEVYE